MASKYSTPVSSDVEGPDPERDAARILVGLHRGTAVGNSLRADDQIRKSPSRHASREVGGAPHGCEQNSLPCRENVQTTGEQPYACTQSVARHTSILK